MSLVCANVLVFFLTLFVTLIAAAVTGVVRVMPVTPVSIALYVVMTVVVRQLIWGERSRP